jgi:TM2 domain-containing membrane protein YozV
VAVRKRKDELKMAVYLLIGYIFDGLGELWFDTNTTTIFWQNNSVFHISKVALEYRTEPL